MSARRRVGQSVRGSGRQIRGGMRPAVFDPNAVDADGDGRVQDSTRFERPRFKPLGSESIIARNWDNWNNFGRALGEPEPQRPSSQKPRTAREQARLDRELEESRTRLRERMQGSPPTGITPSRSQSTVSPSTSSPKRSKAERTLKAMNDSARVTEFDASREYGDYETKFPKHEVDGIMGRDSADITKMREMMKGLIKEAKTEGVQYNTFSNMSDADLQEFWSILNAMKEPETRAQFLAMMLADFELGIRKLGRERAKSGPAPFEDPTKVEKILDNLRGRNLI